MNVALRLGVSKKRNQYVGKAGQMAVMAEFLLRGYNVAMPEVDTGDDIFVVRDDNGELSRIQVKTANGTVRKNGVSATFNLPMAQLDAVEPLPSLHYVFVVRTNDVWLDFIVIRHEELRLLRRLNEKVGRIAGGNLILEVLITETDVTVAGESFQKYRNDWQRWPDINP